MSTDIESAYRQVHAEQCRAWRAANREWVRQYDAARKARNQVRDPALWRKGGRLYLTHAERKARYGDYWRGKEVRP